MSSEARALIEAMRALVNGESGAEPSWSEVNDILRLSARLSNWSVDWQRNWRRAHHNQILTKWDLLSEEERAEMDATPFHRPGTKEPGWCTPCGTPLPTEGAFARHYVIRALTYPNLGYCPEKKEVHNE